MRLNGWQKLGIALSILWAVTAAVHTRSEDVERAENFVKFSYTVCKDSKMAAKNSDLSSCEKEKAANMEIWMKDSGKNAAFAALAPIPFGWLAGFILLYLCRIQVAGFKAAVPWVEFSKSKKGVAVFA